MLDFLFPSTVVQQVPGFFISAYLARQRSMLAATCAHGRDLICALFEPRPLRLPGKPFHAAHREGPVRRASKSGSARRTTTNIIMFVYLAITIRSSALAVRIPRHLALAPIALAFVFVLSHGPANRRRVLELGMGVGSL